MSCDVTLKAKGLKLTPQRRLIMDIIHESGAHLTGEDVITAVRARMPGVNKSTIYRTLELLERLGCVFKSELGDRFIYHHAEEGHHHHLTCSSCGKSIDCDEEIFLPVEKKLAEKYGFSADFRHVMMSGLCRKCKSRA
ncbi:MAG: Fur family transcriptional regulator [Chloroflexota bacterium]